MERGTSPLDILYAMPVIAKDGGRKKFLSTSFSNRPLSLAINHMSLTQYFTGLLFVAMHVQYVQAYRPTPSQFGIGTIITVTVNFSLCADCQFLQNMVWCQTVPPPHYTL